MKDRGICICCLSRKAIPNKAKCEVCRNNQKKWFLKMGKKKKEYLHKNYLKTKQRKLNKIKKNEAKRIEYLRRIDEKIMAGIARKLKEKENG